MSIGSFYLTGKKSTCYKLAYKRADVAQLVEQLIRNQQVSGSSPLIGFINKHLNLAVYKGLGKGRCSAFFVFCQRLLKLCPLRGTNQKLRSFCVSNVCSHS